MLIQMPTLLNRVAQLYVLGGVDVEDTTIVVENGRGKGVQRQTTRLLIERSELIREAKYKMLDVGYWILTQMI